MSDYNKECVGSGVRPTSLYVLKETESNSWICSVPSYQAWFYLSRKALDSLLSRYGQILQVISNDASFDESLCKDSYLSDDESAYADLQSLLLSLSTGIELLNDDSIFENPVVSITSRCNLRCPYCYMSIPSLPSSNRHDVAKQKIKKFIDGVIEFGGKRTRTVQFFGGEPTLHPDLPELINYALERKLYVRISTNGTASRIRSAAYLPYTRHRDVEWRVALDSHIPEKHEEKRGPGTFKSLQMNLKYLKDQGSNVSIKTVLSKDNIDDFPEYIRYGYHNGFRVTYGVLGTVGEAKTNSLVANLSRMDVIDRILSLYYSEPELISTLGPSPFGRVIRALYVKKTTALPPFFFYMHHDEAVYPMDELVHKEFQVGTWENIDIQAMRNLHSKYCLNKESCLKCPIDPFCYKGSYADTFDTVHSLDGEFTSCEERRDIYYRLMGLGPHGEKMARMMFAR